MFYNFNRHKEKYRTEFSSNKEAVQGNPKSGIPAIISRSFGRLRVRWQWLLITILLAIGSTYSAYLIGASFFGWPAAGNLEFVRQRFSTPPKADQSDWAEAHASYLDSLEAAFIKDSINQSQLQNQDADNNLLP
ncbi:hypothetical protein [Dyadobacter sp. 32]|uniref:hypothetical protein n=1 Tax=Dyadobacter sp. 32 TaxID=538966 RepID=UPI0011EC3A85